MSNHRSWPRRLLGLGCEHGDRVGIVAETNPMFHRFFFACLYAGLVPVALPAGVQLGARQAYVNQIARMLKSCGAKLAVAGESHAAFLEEAASDLDLIYSGTPDEFDALPDSDRELHTPGSPVILLTCNTRQVARDFHVVLRSITKRF